MLKKIINSFMLQRLFISGLTYCSSLYMANKTGATFYGELAFIIFYIKSLPAMNLGISYGFIFFAYQSKDGFYQGSYIIGYFLLSLIALTVGSFLINPLILFLGLPVLAFFICDPFLKVQRVFLFSLLPELFLLVSCVLSYLIRDAVNDLISAALILLFLTIITLYAYKHIIYRSPLFPKTQFITSFKQIKALIVQGYASYLYQLALFLFLFLDRYMLNQFYPEKALGVCMLAFQFCQASLYLVSSWNFSSVVDIGELFKAKELNNSFILNKLGRAALAGLLPLVITYFIIRATGNVYFKDYPDLPLVFTIIAVGFYFLNLAACVSPILFFLEKQLTSSLALIGCAGLVSFNYLILAAHGASYVTVLEYNYFILALSSIFTIGYALYTLQTYLGKEVLT